MIKTTMTTQTKTKDKLERIKAYALKALMESKEDNWSYIWDNPAIEEFGFYRWRFVDDEAWEGETIWLRGEVSDARIIELASSEAILTPAEDAIWRRNLARWYATETDVCCYASLIPVSLEGDTIDGYAVFVTGQHHPYETPALEGAFETRDEAIRHLQSEGALASPDPWVSAGPKGPLQ